MKKLLLLSLVFFSTISFSQNFVQDNKQWNVYFEAFGIGGIFNSTEIFYTSGDTLFDDQNYKKIYVSFDSLTSSSYKGALLEENNQVYYIDGNGNQGLLYDFNLETGDTTYVITDFSYDDELMTIVELVDTVEIDGVLRKRLWLQNEEGMSMDDCWIEGIGSNNGPLYTFIHLHLICPWWQLSCCFENGIPVFEDENLECYMTNVGFDEFDANQIIIHPNPINSGEKLYIQINDQINFIECFNIWGKRMFMQLGQMKPELEVCIPDLPKGIYLFHIHSDQSKKMVKKIMIN